MLQMAFYKGNILVLSGYDADGVGWINKAITTFARTVLKPNS